MKTTLPELVAKYNIPKKWLAEIVELPRTQISNWVTNPEKYPIPPAKKKIVEEKLREFGNLLTNIEI